MPTPPEVAPSAPALMAAGGFYNRHAWLQAAGIELALPALASAAAAVPVGAPVMIADYGCSQGRNSLRPVRVALDILRARAADIPVSVVHIDQPANDFASLFAVMNEAEESYLRTHPETYALAVGRSFFQQVLPPASVTLGWSSFAAMWLTRTPPEAAGHVSALFAPPEIAARLREQGATEWRAFLIARAAELRPGGRLVVLFPGPGEAGGLGLALLLRAGIAALDRLVAEGRLDREARARAFIPTLPRTGKEMRAPFEAGQFAGLELEAFEDYPQLPDPAWERFLHDGDLASLADAYLSFFQATFLPSLLHSMAPFDSSEERERIGLALAQGLRQALQADPRPYAQIPLHLVVLRRV
jgi:hypothetical protein